MRESGSSQESAEMFITTEYHAVLLFKKSHSIRFYFVKNNVQLLEMNFVQDIMLAHSQTYCLWDSFRNYELEGLNIVKLVLPSRELTEQQVRIMINFCGFRVFIRLVQLTDLILFLINNTDIAYQSGLRQFIASSLVILLFKLTN